MSEALDILCVSLENELRSQLAQQGKNASMSLSKSISVVSNATPQGYEVVGRANTYAKYVEYGRRAGVKGVPISALIDWLHNKKIDLQGKSARSVAFAIQRTIKKKGIKAVPFIAMSLEAADAQIRATGRLLLIEQREQITQQIIKKIGEVWQI